MHTFIGTQCCTFPLTRKEIKLSYHSCSFLRARSCPSSVFALFCFSNKSPTYMLHQYCQPCLLLTVNVADLASFPRRFGAERRTPMKPEILGNLQWESFQERVIPFRVHIWDEHSCSPPALTSARPRSLCCITVADDNMTRSGKAACCFPGDPRIGRRVNPTREHLDALEKMKC